MASPRQYDLVFILFVHFFKAWKLEQERLREEELSKKMKKDKGGKSSAKGDRDSARESRKTASPSKRNTEEPKTPDNPRPPADTREDTQTHRESSPVSDQTLSFAPDVWTQDRKRTRMKDSHNQKERMPPAAGKINRYLDLQ